MPSQYQSGSDAGDYPTDAHRMLATKNDLTIAALIRGIRKPERAQAYIDAEIELADEEDRDVRKEIIGACNRKKRALEDAHADATDVDVDATDTPDEADDADTGDDGAHDGDDSDDPFPDAPRYDSVDALEQAVEDHEHGDVFTTAKPKGTLAGCFKCEAYIGFVPHDRDDGRGL